MNATDFLWTEKYRPHTVADTILPDSLKTQFQNFVDQKNVPNLLLNGSAGVGKTTIAKAMLDELGADYITINASKDGNIDTLRTDIQNFASSVSFTGGRKYVILDEADYLNPNSTQPALRNFMEEYSKNCGFILTCNLKDRIIDPLQSRCSVITFKLPKAEKGALAKMFFKRIGTILDNEGIPYDAKCVAEVVKLHLPDWRRVINELQRYASIGCIDTGILAAHSFDNLKDLVSAMKDKRFSDVRKWVSDNSDLDSAFLYRTLYDRLPELLANEPSRAAAIQILAEYQYKEAFVANSQINRAACFATLMVEAEFS